MLKARARFITHVTTEGALLLALKTKLYHVPLDMAQLRPPSTSAYQILSAAIRVVLTFEVQFRIYMAKKRKVERSVLSWSTFTPSNIVYKVAGTGKGG